MSQMLTIVVASSFIRSILMRLKYLNNDQLQCNRIQDHQVQQMLGFNPKLPCVFLVLETSKLRFYKGITVQM